MLVEFAPGAHWISRRQDARRLQLAAEAVHTQWSGERRRRVLEETEIETRTDEIGKMTEEEGRCLGGKRPDHDGVTGRVLTIPRCQECYRALVRHLTRFMDAFVKLRRSREYDGEQERGDESTGHDRSRQHLPPVTQAFFHRAGIFNEHTN